MIGVPKPRGKKKSRTRGIKRGKQLVKSRIKRGKAAIVRRRRTKKEFARIYGSKARVEFVKSLPCIVRNSWHGGLIEVAHIKNGGTGRKADARFTVPACSRHHECFHQWGRETFEQEFGIDLEQEAANTESAWQAFKTTQTVRNTE